MTRARSRPQQAREERERRARRLWQLGAAFVTAAAVVIIAIVVSSAGRPKVASPTIFNGIPQQGILLGRPSAPVTMTEFADLQCPFCREYTARVLPALVRDYVRTGKVKMVFRDLAFLGDDSVTAGRAAAAAGAQGKLWQFVDAFYAEQGDENSGYVTDEFVRSIAEKVPGLDVERLMRGRGAPFTLQQIQQARAEKDRLGVSSTPTFFLQHGGGPQKRLEYSDFTPGDFTGPIQAALRG